MEECGRGARLLSRVGDRGNDLVRRIRRALAAADRGVAAVEATIVVLALFGLVAGGLALVLLQNVSHGRLDLGRHLVLAAAVLCSVAGAMGAARSVATRGKAGLAEGRGAEIAALGFFFAATRCATRSPTAVDPLQRAAVLWIAVLGASLATRRREHITIEVLERSLPARPARILRALLALAAAGACAVFAKIAADFVLDSRARQKVYFTWYELDFAFPDWWVKVVLPAGLAIMSVRFLFQVAPLEVPPQ
jgi:TRAP-type C4-dicarboxylate transport system permease small subunit